MAALAAGRIDRYRATVIADELGGLGDEHAAVVEQQVLDHAPDQTTGQLRAAARRVVLAADPAAARERKERAARDARVERWDEHAGTAALAGRDLPPADVLAADHNLSALAGSLRRAGVSGTMDQLRAQAYLALLTGQPLTALTGRGTPLGDRWTGTGPGGSWPGGSGPGGSWSGGSSPDGSWPGGSGHGGSWPGGSSPDGSWPGAGRGEPGHGELGSGPCGHGPLGAVNLTMPLATWLGLSHVPGHAAGYGPLDASDSHDLAARLAQQPGSRWCITLTGEDGRPVAHGCARTGPGPSGRSRPPPRRPPRGGGPPGRSPRNGGSPRRTATPRPGRPTSLDGGPTSTDGRPTSTNGGPPSPDGRLTSPNGWRASLSAGWRQVIAAICGSRLPTGRRPGCATWSRSGSRPVRSPAAAGPPSVVTRTTPCLMTRAAGRVSAIWPPPAAHNYAGTLTAFGPGIGRPPLHFGGAALPDDP